MHGCSLRMRESRQVLALREHHIHTGHMFVHDKSERRESRTFRAYLRVSSLHTTATFHSWEARAQLEYWSQWVKHTLSIVPIIFFCLTSLSLGQYHAAGYTVLHNGFSDQSRSQRALHR
jgi:hypothetical protein